jgi:hypothetical protein
MLRCALTLLGLVLLAGCGSATRLEVVSDDCLDDDVKVHPGECGCGVPEERCGPLKAALVHRYAFDGFGTVAFDDIGNAPGDIVGLELTGTGQLHLQRDGAEEQYVNLPNGIVSPLESATFEAWVVWDTPQTDAFWERIFDFGVSTAGENQRSDGESYIFLAPAMFRTAYKNSSIPTEILVDGQAAFPQNSLVHVAVVVDTEAQQLRLYLNAVENNMKPVTLDQPLRAINDVNNWLGRSQFQRDTRFGGTFLEFRIYATALSQAQLADSLELGDSPFFLRRQSPPPTSAVQLEP